MTILLCANPDCAIPRRHVTGCADEQCGGCLPGRAADGLRLCWVHTNRIGSDAMKAAALYDEASLALIGSGGEPTRGGIPGGINISDIATEARTLIRHTLVGWVRLISEQRGISLPGSYRLVPLGRGVEGPLNRAWRTNDTAAMLGRYIATHAQWLAAHGAAGDVSSELAEIVAKGRRAAYPDGARIIHIGACPQEVEGLPCGGKIRALLRRADSYLPSAVTCDLDEAHTWTGGQWRTLGRQMATRRAA